MFRRNAAAGANLPHLAPDNEIPASSTLFEPAWVLCIALSIVAFLIDSTTPHGVADGFLYVLPVLVCFWVRGAYASMYTAMALMLPLGLGGLISPAGASIWIEVTNRLLGATTIWLTALLISHNARLAAQREHLLQRIRDLNQRSEQLKYGEQVNLSRWLDSGVARNLSTVGGGLDVIADENRGEHQVRLIAGEARELIDAAIIAVQDEEDRIRAPVEPDELEWFLNRHIAEFRAITGMTVTVAGRMHLSVAQENRAALCSDLVREVLINVARHAHASHVALEFRESPEGAFISMQDDGIGLRPVGQSRSCGLGLLQLEERLKAIAGSLTVTNVVPHGVRIEAWVPRERTAAGVPI
jgi:signal transduction histidine kinase